MGEFDPAQRLIALLGSTPKHPWPALIPQVLVWCFRRFCIEKIVSSGGNLVDSLWDDHLELVHMYCPKGLEAASTEWFTPDNIETLYSPLDEYNDYFVEFIHELDSAISNEDYERQDALSGFLDADICNIFKRWLQDSPFIIFPMSPEKEDEFTDSQFKALIRALMNHAEAVEPVDDVPPVEPVEEAVAPPVEPVQEAVAPPVEPVEEAVAPPVEPVQEAVSPPQTKYYSIPQPSLLWHFVPPPLMPDTLQPYEPKPTVHEQPLPPTPPSPIPSPSPSPRFIILPYNESSPPTEAPIIRSVTKALAYRRTKRLRHRHNSRGKTRRSQAAA
jgi:hypothetical protein